MSVHFSKTIIAQASAKGKSALSVVRMSGSLAHEIALRVIQKETFTSERMLCNLFDTSAGCFEQALLLIFRDPKSFTGEDVVEFHCHGNQLIVQKLIETCLCYGASLASPGEFTQRALLNGKLDLSKAEAIMDLIDAKSELLLKASSAQLNGGLGKKIDSLKNKLLEAMALIHGPLDFPLETGFVEVNLADINVLICEVERELNKLAANARSMSILRQGLKTVILGRPNVGKSSLLNLLLSRERAIVSDIPGTTRDFLTEELLIRDIPVTLIDTAGLREQTTDAVEQLGIEKAKSLAEQADLILFVFDSSVGWIDEDQQLLDSIRLKSWQAKLIVLANKQDKLSGGQSKESPQNLELKIIPLSCSTGLGLEALEEEIERLVFVQQDDTQLHEEASRSVSDDLLLDGGLELSINQRQAACLQRAKELLVEIKFCAKDVELISVKLEAALQALNDVNGTGMHQSEQALQSVFSRFCIGK